MTERPILMSAESVRGIFAGRRAQTRRVIRPQPEKGQTWMGWVIDPICMDLHTGLCPYGVRGDRLWVRETLWRQYHETGHRDPYTGEHDAWEEETGKVRYVADDPDWLPLETDGTWWKKIPSIHTYKEESRITLSISDVRVERVQEITPGDAIAEGYPPSHKNFDEYPIDWFGDLWDSINADRGYSWDSNPYVWVIEFEVIQ